jgi:hypothetical protein
MVRIIGSHAIGLNYEFTRRVATYDTLPKQDQRISTMSLTYNFLSNTNLGAVSWGDHE